MCVCKRKSNLIRLKGKFKKNTFGETGDSERERERNREASGREVRGRGREEGLEATKRLSSDVTVRNL